MTLTFSDLRKPSNPQLVDPSTGRMREEWLLYFDGLTKRLNGAVGELGGTIGDVTGPASATDNNFASFDGSGGKTIQDSGFSGASFQPTDADLTAIAGLSPSNDDIIQRKAGAWTNRTIVQLLSDLAAPGTTFQPLDSDLTAIASLSTTSYGLGLLAIVSATALAAEVDGFFLTPTEGNAAYQPLDEDLTAIAALSPASNSFIVGNGSAWTSMTPAQALGALCNHALFNGTSSAAVSGTYARVGTTVTVSVTGHGHLVGHRVYCDFTTGTAADGAFTVQTVADANTFTVTHGTSGSTSGNISLPRRTITASSGVQSVVYQATAGSYVINFSTAFADANYHISGSAGTTDADSTFSPDTDNITTLHCEIAVRDNSGGALEDSTRVSIMFFPTS